MISAARNQLEKIKRSILAGKPVAELPADRISHVSVPRHSGKKVFFFHVMKTGGVTFRRILSSVYGPDFKVCYDPTAEAIEASLPEARAIEFHSFHFKGHLAHMHSDLMRQQRWDILEGNHCFTMLREPVDQAISLYYYLVRRRLFLEPVYISRGLKWPESIEEYVDSVFHFNLQTAFLADKHQLDDDTAANRNDLAAAKAMLSRLQMHVGLTERFADSMNIFESITGTEIPGGIIFNENRNPDRLPVEAISSNLRDRIREQSALDIDLYEFGREMFLADLGRCAQRRTYSFQDALLGDKPAVGAPSIRLKPASPIAEKGSLYSDPAAATRKTVFLHIMKTGGMTFRHILSSIYGDSFHVVENPEVESVSRAFQQYGCIEFHTLPFRGDFVHMHAHLAEQRRWDVLAGADIFTMFRDPVDQVISQYFYMKEKRALIEPAYLVNKIPFPETIEEYLQNPAHLNNQLGFLAGKYRLKGGNDCTVEDLEEAKEMLIRLNVHPGLTERFAESLHVFETVTGRLLPGGKILNQNQNPNRIPLEAISAKTKDKIRELSLLDNALYSFARDIFMKDVAQCGATRQYTFIDSHTRAEVRERVTNPGT